MNNANDHDILIETPDQANALHQTVKQALIQANNKRFPNRDRDQGPGDDSILAEIADTIIDHAATMGIKVLLRRRPKSYKGIFAGTEYQLHFGDLQITENAADGTAEISSGNRTFWKGNLRVFGRAADEAAGALVDAAVSVGRGSPHQPPLTQRKLEKETAALRASIQRRVREGSAGTCAEWPLATNLMAIPAPGTEGPDYCPSVSEAHRRLLDIFGNLAEINTAAAAAAMNLGSDDPWTEAGSLGADVGGAAEHLVKIPVGDHTAELHLKNLDSKDFIGAKVRADLLVRLSNRYTNDSDILVIYKNVFDDRDKLARGLIRISRAINMAAACHDHRWLSLALDVGALDSDNLSLALAGLTTHIADTRTRWYDDGSGSGESWLETAQIKRTIYDHNPDEKILEYDLAICDSAAHVHDQPAYATIKHCEYSRDGGHLDENDENDEPDEMESDLGRTTEAWLTAFDDRHSQTTAVVTKTIASKYHGLLGRAIGIEALERAIGHQKD